MSQLLSFPTNCSCSMPLHALLALTRHAENNIGLEVMNLWSVRSEHECIQQSLRGACNVWKLHTAAVVRFLKSLFQDPISSSSNDCLIKRRGRRRFRVMVSALQPFILKPLFAASPPQKPNINLSDTTWKVQRHRDLQRNISAGYLRL